MEEIDFLISILNKKTENLKSKKDKYLVNKLAILNIEQLEIVENSYVHNKNLDINNFRKLHKSNGINTHTKKLPKLLPKITKYDDYEKNDSSYKSNKINSLKSITSNINMRYLEFRPLIDKLENKPNTPKDLGYHYSIKGNDCPLVRNILEDNGFVEVNLNKFSDAILLWSSGCIKNNIYINIKNYQKVNHFPRSVELTRKDLLYKNLSKLQHMYPNLSNSLAFIPESYILPNEYNFLKEAAEKEPNAIWIFKPVSSSQGRGIYVSNKIQDIPNGIQSIACKYIQNPYLINGFKFDLRIYVLLTSIKPLRIYIYDEGLVRFATEKYNLGQTFENSNKFMHLTNYAVNRISKKFIPNTDPFIDYVGSKWSLTALKNYFNSIVSQ